MEFGAASIIPEKYAQILADELLVERLALRLSLHSTSPDDEDAVAAEFKSFLNDLGGEKMLGRLAEMRGRSEGKEKRIVQAALARGLDKAGRDGSLEELAEFLRRADLTLGIRRAAGDAVLDGIDACSGGGRISLAVELLEKGWLSEEIHVKAMEAAGRNHYVDYAEYMENVIGLLGQEWAVPELKEEARRALLEWGIDECLERADPDQTWTLLGLDENGRIMTKDVDKGKLVSLVLGLTANENAGEAVRIKAVKAAAACIYVDRGRIIEALEEALEGEMPPALMAVVENALEVCGAQKLSIECTGKGPDELVVMRASAKSGEKRFLDEAIIRKFGELAGEGRAEELAAMLDRKDLSQRLRGEGEKALLEAVDARAGGEDADALLRLLKRKGLPEKAQIRIIEVAGSGPDADCVKLVDALGNVLSGKDVPRKLKEAAENALPGAVEGCIRKKDEKLGISLGTAAALFRKAGIPWETTDRVVEACNKTGQWSKVAHLFKRNDLPKRTAKAAERMMLESMDFFGQRAIEGETAGEDGSGIGLVAHILWERRLPESVYLKAIELCRRHPSVHGHMFVNALGEMFARPDVTQKVKDAAENALVEEELRECAMAGYPDLLQNVRGAPGVPERVVAKIKQVLDMRRRVERMEEVRRAEEAGTRSPGRASRPSGDQGFVDSRFRPPKGTESEDAEKISTAPTRKVETGKKG